MPHDFKKLKKKKPAFHLDVSELRKNGLGVRNTVGGGDGREKFSQGMKLTVIVSIFYPSEKFAIPV